MKYSQSIRSCMLGAALLAAASGCGEPKAPPPGAPTETKQSEATVELDSAEAAVDGSKDGRRAGSGT